MSSLDFSHVFFTNDNQSILKDVSVSIDAGDFLSIVGPSGSGKSTFLKLCCHLISPTDGAISFKGKNLNDYNPMELRKQIAYCFQMPYLFGDHVKENLEFPFVVRNVPFEQERVDELFSVFHMANDYLHKEVKNLSGGEKQRIALIRSLLFKPEILLLDEVTSALDTANTEIVEQAVKSLNQKGTTILWITHNTEQSRKHANKLLTIENGEIHTLEAIQ
ncbi:ATP-binding cassette domain-containing protein [Sporolactobacillus sp. STSJ-5]|uniref:ABC transporter ATP-binding protein n=1 Tax=Sporolactobacillus sp. STSJ-5 TaxID=2965076 RepID=UPI00210719BF|nr:ATP-binding cassette domain-containing protein [Sporolactobacillus sp. STSJ-5]